MRQQRVASYIIIRGRNRRGVALKHDFLLAQLGRERSGRGEVQEVEDLGYYLDSVPVIDNIQLCSQKLSDLLIVCDLGPHSLPLLLAAYSYRTRLGCESYP